jgi:hypothetical protein
MKGTHRHARPAANWKEAKLVVLSRMLLPLCAQVNDTRTTREFTAHTALVQRYDTQSRYSRAVFF